MNFKACCGLLGGGGKDEEDHDYDDVEHEPLPKPRTAADLRRKQQEHMHMSSAPPSVYAAAGYSAKAVSRAASGAERTTGSGDIQKAAWEAGAATPASASAPAAHGHHPQHRQRRREDGQQQDQQQHGPRTMKPLTRGSSGGGGNGSYGSSSSSSSSNNRAKSRGSSSRTTALPSSSGNASAGGSGGGGQDAYVDARGAVGPGGGSVRSRNSLGAGADALRPGTEAIRPGPKGAVGLGKHLQQQPPPPPLGGSAGGGGTTYNSSRGSFSHSKRAGAAVGGGGAGAGAGAAARRPSASAKFDLAGFVEKLKGGLIVTKINRQGRAKVRTLFYDHRDRMLWWNEPGSRQRARGSASLLSISRKERPFPVASLVKVKMADEMDEPFCFDGDVDKSFQLVFPARTVDLVAKDAEEASLLARGFQELQVSASAV